MSLASGVIGHTFTTSNPKCLDSLNSHARFRGFRHFSNGRTWPELTFGMCLWLAIATSFYGTVSRRQDRLESSTGDVIIDVFLVFKVYGRTLHGVLFERGVLL